MRWSRLLRQSALIRFPKNTDKTCEGPEAARRKEPMEKRIRVFKIGDEGSITISMPDMVGRYLLVEELDGQVIISPYDLRWQSEGASIAKFGANMHYVSSGNGSLPSA